MELRAREEPITNNLLALQSLLARLQGAIPANKPISGFGLANLPGGVLTNCPMRAPRRQFWIAAQTDYKSEGLAARSLVGVASSTYNPLYRERSRNGVRRVLPVLQGYLLVQIDRLVERQIGDVARTKGVKTIVGQVGDEEVSWLRGLEDEHGYVRLDGEEPPVFAFGEHVLALSGAFREQRGEYRKIDPSNSRRAIVAFEILSRVIESSLPRYDLARA